MSRSEKKRRAAQAAAPKDATAAKTGFFARVWGFVRNVAGKVGGFFGTVGRKVYGAGRTVYFYGYSAGQGVAGAARFVGRNVKKAAVFCYNKVTGLFEKKIAVTEVEES